ncbi:hypothetical protein [Roseateles sp.]|uniref:hypothetical protein n=1 Tax=Roseateles sp. TaxID=1971397 RepID=UPI002F410076
MKTKQDGNQVLYADQPAELSLGPFVSRLTLGIVESRSDAPIPVLSFAMPTTALLQMAKDIILQIESPSFAVGAARSLALAADVLTLGIGDIDSVPGAKDGTPRRTAKGRSTSARRTAPRK